MRGETQMMQRLTPTIDILGMPLARISLEETVDWVFEGLRHGNGSWIITANVDHLQRYALNPDIVKLYEEADLIVADGVPLLWAARLLGSPLPERVAGSDLVWLLSERAARMGQSVYLLGSAPGIVAQAVRRFHERWPELRIVGTSSPMVSTQLTAEEKDALRRDIEIAIPDIVYVALGSPKQEHVIAALRPLFPGICWIGVGISLSFVAGELQRAPLWMQKAGLEWVYRMFQEPSRLMKRYLRNLPFAAQILLKASVAACQNKYKMK